jgi:hypothetical protein
VQGHEEGAHERALVHKRTDVPLGRGQPDR